MTAIIFEKERYMIPKPPPCRTCGRQMDVRINIKQGLIYYRCDACQQIVRVK